jgi:CBS domain-containing protein
MRRVHAREAKAIGGTAPFALPDAETGSTDTAALERIDSYPYRSSVAEVMSSPPAILPAGADLSAALDVLIERKVSSVFVEGADGAVGILTERDILRAIHAEGPGALDAPLERFRSVPLHAISADALVYRAIGRMDRLDIRHLGVRDRAGRIVGAVTTRNLLRHRASTAMILGDEIAAGEDPAALAASWSRVPAMAERLGAEGVDPRMTAGVISAEIRMLTRRAAQLAEARMAADGKGGPPVPYAVLVLGPAGRGESLIAPDQDNAIVYASGDAGGAEDAWFAALGAHMNDILDAAGIPYCNGGVMAREPGWRRSDAAWRRTIDHWVTRQSGEDLLNVDIFFDAVCVHGDHALGEGVWSYAYERGKAQRTFWRMLAETLGLWRSPVGLFGMFRAGADGRVDLKLGGLMPLFTAGRVLAVKTGSPVRSTPDRLHAAAEAGLASDSLVETLDDAHRVILGAMLRQQVIDVAAGVSPGPRVDPHILSRRERKELRDALKRIPDAIDLVREGMM